MRVSVGRVVAVAAVAVLGATGAMSGIAAGRAGANGTVVVAEFTSSSPILVGNDVKVDGVVVGEVADIRLGDDGLADVALDLDAAAMPVYRDARVSIRPVSLLGERYVQLERGTPGSPELPFGGLVPAEQTSSNVDLNQILNVVDEPTGMALAYLVTTLGEGLRGNGEDVAAALRALAPALRDTEALTTVLEDQNVLLGNLVDRVEPVAAAIAADDGRSLDALVASADRLLAASAAQQAALDRTLAELPSALRSARGTLGELAGTAEQTTPMLRELRPVTQNLTEIAAELESFSDSLDPALASSEPVLERARELLAEAGPVAADLRAGGPDLVATAAGARPLAEDLTANLDNVLDFVRYFALATNGHDGLSHYLRVMVMANPDSVTGHAPRGLPVPQLLPDAAPIGGEQPGRDVPGTPEQPTEPGPGLLHPPEPEGNGGVTGLTPEQESDMLGSLLGGGS